MEKNTDGGGLSVTLIINDFVSWWPKFQQIRVIFGGERAKKPTKRAYFMAAVSPQNNLKIYNFGTTNGMKIKLTAIMYLNKIYHLEKNWGVTHRV